MPIATKYWTAIIIVAAITAASMKMTGLSFEWASGVKLVLVCVGAQALAWFYQVKRPDIRLATTLSLMAKLIAFSSLATLLSYAAAATDCPTWDRSLLRWDRALGLDWFAYLSFIQYHTTLELACRVAYQSLIVQIFIAVVVLGLSGHLKRAEEFVLSYAIAGLIAVAISYLMPAIAMFVHIESDNNSRYLVETPFVTTIKSLRDGSLTYISLAQMDGIITFPSFHAALGVIFGYSFWVLRGTRWVGALINLLLILGTPINGGHYFVDVFAGLAIGVVAICGARRVTATRFLTPHSAETSSPLDLKNSADRERLIAKPIRAEIFFPRTLSLRRP